MIPLESLQVAQFEPLVGQIFRLMAGQVIELRLDEAKPFGDRWPEATRDPFVLVFGGASGLLLPQAIYRFDVPELGELEMFISQTANGPRGSKFEAVFT
jgi:hypothetical protein